MEISETTNKINELRDAAMLADDPDEAARMDLAADQIETESRKGGAR